MYALALLVYAPLQLVYAALELVYAGCGLTLLVHAVLRECMRHEAARYSCMRPEAYGMRPYATR